VVQDDVPGPERDLNTFLMRTGRATPGTVTLAPGGRHLYLNDITSYRHVIITSPRKGPLSRTDIRSVSVIELIDRKQAAESRESAAGNLEATDNVPKAE